MKPSQVATNRPQHLCIFGDCKTGKSTLVAKLLLAGYKLTWISMDNGHDVLFKFGIPMDQLDEQLNIIILPDTKTNPVAWRTCLKLITWSKLLICDAHGEVDCAVCSKNKESATWTSFDPSTFGPKDILVFDHVGQLATSIMTAAYKRNKKSDEDKPEWEEYGIQGNQLDKFLTAIQQCRYNVVCITHVLEVEMEDGGKKLSPLCGTTNFSRNLGKYFDHVIYCHMRNAKHRFASMTGYQNNLILGSRRDIAIENMEEPSLIPFFDGTVSVAESQQDSKEAKVILSKLADKLEKPKEVEKTEAATSSAAELPQTSESESKGDSNEVVSEKDSKEALVAAEVLHKPPAVTSALNRAALLASLKARR